MEEHAVGVSRKRSENQTLELYIWLYCSKVVTTENSGNNTAKYLEGYIGQCPEQGGSGGVDPWEFFLKPPYRLCDKSLGREH
jgi:hypothetical protein